MGLECFHTQNKVFFPSVFPGLHPYKSLDMFQSKWVHHQIRQTEHLRYKYSWKGWSSQVIFLSFGVPPVLRGGHKSLESKQTPENMLIFLWWSPRMADSAQRPLLVSPGNQNCELIPAQVQDYPELYYTLITSKWRQMEISDGKGTIWHTDSCYAGYVHAHNCAFNWQ